ncbi:VraH family protein [Staphylococcus sp. 18_1_E_LY]|uniref:VraH family protein n=1 Tax=Staphylococcus lloydii TaxID=2781774 RepID=A0A7T1AZR4_9STAP|nr:VraH family protein [Staphylococcus lloydii]MBF7019708.1 VraH family protein [Staphylococcus lloydii]MBF7027436.1 VraH family protein [Staphylococcus lloydii]QPM75095.1 VraH family protein [Staphylococcus lloydii]
MKLRELFSRDDNNKVKVFIRNKYNEFLNLEMNTYNITVLVISIILVSIITTPFLGIPLGILVGMYIIKRKNRK